MNTKKIELVKCAKCGDVVSKYNTMDDLCFCLPCDLPTAMSKENNPSIYERIIVGRMGGESPYINGQIEPHKLASVLEEMENNMSGIQAQITGLMEMFNAITPHPTDVQEPSEKPQESWKEYENLIRIQVLNEAIEVVKKCDWLNTNLVSKDDIITALEALKK